MSSIKEVICICCPCGCHLQVDPENDYNVTGNACPNGAAYGSESLFNSLRLAIALREQPSELDLKLFLMSDAVTAGLRGQKPAEGYNIQQMLEILTAQNVPVKLCKTCTDGRGITALPLIDGVEIGTLVELAQWTLAADKILTF